MDDFNFCTKLNLTCKVIQNHKILLDITKGKITYIVIYIQHCLKTWNKEYMII
jgi:hypothetical protein